MASQDIRLIDKAADVGGTWYWNRYPGIACDVESYVYMPLLEEVGYVPEREVQQRPGDLRALPPHRPHYDLYRNACLQTEVTEVRWDPRRRLRWLIATDRGDAMRARFVCLANGFLQKPKLPGIPGIDDFRGHIVSHQPLGLRLHRRRLHGRLARSWRTSASA